MEAEKNKPDALSSSVLPVEFSSSSVSVLLTDLRKGCGCIMKTFECRESVFMANPSDQVCLPHAVQHLLNQIYEEKSMPPASPDVLRQLAELGEERATKLLSRVSKYPIRSNLDNYLMRCIQNDSVVNSPQKPSCASPCSSPASVACFSHKPSQRTAEKGKEILENQALVALGELEFRKAFLLLNYIGEEKLENAITSDEIRKHKELPMRLFEERIWEAVGRKYIIDPNERKLSREWDLGKPHVYHCHVSADGILTFKGPFLHTSRNHLQKCLGDDNVLIVKFAEESNGRGRKTSSHKAEILYKKFGKEGIRVGLRLYRFFVFKDGGKEEKKKDPTTSSVKCYFVRVESLAYMDKKKFYILSNKTMFDARSCFMHAHMLPNLDKYMARFSLILSKTLKLDIDFSVVNVENIPDINCKDKSGKPIFDGDKPRIHTDGTGFISEDLARLCPNNVFEGKHISDKNYKGIPTVDELGSMKIAMDKTECNTCEPPLLIQFRLFHMGCAVKGTVLVNKKLPPRTIQIRPSMIKVETDFNLLNVPHIDSMEIVATSNHPKKTYLSKNLIALLSYGGVPKDYFIDLLMSALEDASVVNSNKRAALRVSISHGDLDEFAVARMIVCGIPLDEPYLQYHLSILAKEEMKSLRGGKLHVPQCYYLMGTVDPTGLLQRDEVSIILENGQISGDVLVYRNPGVHFGDIHKLKARYLEELISYVGHGKYAIFFPCVGSRSLADEIASGDYDGDMYWVSTNPQLLKYYRKSDPWIPNSSSCNGISLNQSVKKPSELSSEEFEDELFRLFLKTRFEPSYAIGAAADSWLAMMDRLLTLRDDGEREKEEKGHLKENILKLIDIYYEALDAPKKGGIKVDVPRELKVEMFPHYMERDNSYTSTSILGIIYDEVNNYLAKLGSAKEIKKLERFKVEVPKICLRKWSDLYDKYRKDMAEALNGHDSESANDNFTKQLKNEAAKEVVKKYKQELYGADELEESKKNIDDIYNEALAMYHIVYDYAKTRDSVNYCNFAWRVAGAALLSFYSLKQGEKVLGSVLRELLG